MDAMTEIACIMVRAIKSKVLVITLEKQEAADRGNALREWCRGKGLPCKMYFSEHTYYIPGFQAVTFIDAPTFNRQNRRDFAGEVYATKQGIITTLEKAPLPIEYIATEVSR